MAGIQCFEDNGSKEHRLIVVESMFDVNSEVSLLAFLQAQSRLLFVFQVESHLENLQQDTENIAVMQTSDDFDYKSILLWLSCGCLAVFIALRFLKCLMRKSERRSENYRLSRQQAFSINEDLKSSMDIMK